jgi:hypothetical protein
VDTLNIFINFQQSVFRKICFSRPMLIKHFLLLLWCRFTFCRLDCAFFVHVVYHLYVSYIYLIQEQDKRKYVLRNFERRSCNHFCSKN